MCSKPAAGTELCGDAGGKQKDADGEGAGDPAAFDPALEHEKVENAEDEDEDGSLCEEGRATAGGDGEQLKALLPNARSGTASFDLAGYDQAWPVQYVVLVVITSG